MKRQRITQAGAGIVILLAMLLCMPLAVLAGSLEPSGPPTEGTMHTLEDIYQKLIDIEQKQSAMDVKINLIQGKIGIGPRFVDNNNGTVTDTRTGLVWLRNANPCGANNWYDAGTYCASLANGQAGLTDGSTAGQWRLPSKAELEGIGTDPPATWESGYPSVTWTMPGAPFTGVQSDTYWSSTAYASKPNSAWHVYMPYGSVDWSYKSVSFRLYAWPVRAGQ